MPKRTPIINDFRSGELTPIVDARADLKDYYRGCRILENAMPIIEGGVARVPGTYYVRPVKTDEGWNIRVTKSGTGTGVVTSDVVGIDCGSSCYAFFVDGITVVLTATPDSGMSFVAWSGDGTGLVTRSLLMNENKVVNAEFTINPLAYYSPWEMVKDSNDFYLCGWWNDGIDYKAYVEKRSLPSLYHQESVGITNFSVSAVNLEFFQDVIVDANYVYTVGRAYNLTTGKTNGIVQRRSKANLAVVDWTYWLVNGANNTSMSSLTQDNDYLYIVGLKILQDGGPTAIIKLTKAGAFVSSYDLPLIKGVWGSIILHSDNYLYLAGECSGNLAMEKLSKDFTSYTGKYSGISGFRKNTIIGANVVGAGGTWDGKLVTQSRPLSNITTINWTRTQDYVVGQVDELYDIINDGTYLYVSGKYYNVGISKYVALYQCIALDGASVIWTKEADTNKTTWHGGCIIDGNDFWVCVYENVSPWRCWIEKRNKSDGIVQQSWILGG